MIYLTLKLKLLQTRCENVVINDWKKGKSLLYA